MRDELLDNNDFNLKFTLQFDDDQIRFLDLVIIKQPEGTLSTDLYRKPTGGNTLLYATTNALRERLLLRGYASTNLKKAFNKAYSHSRHSLLFKPPKLPSTQESVRFITTFSAHHSTLRSILTNHWHLLTDHNILRKHVKPNPELVFRLACSLRDCLTQSHYAPNTTPKVGPNGTLKCGGCPQCPWVLEGQDFVLPNGEPLRSRVRADCGTRGVIYLMLCQCRSFYVGKTIRQRIGDHLYDSGGGKVTTIGRHIGLYHRTGGSLPST